MSQRQTTLRGFNTAQGINPYKNWAKVIDCGDIRKINMKKKCPSSELTTIAITPFDNGVALVQMTSAFRQLIDGPVVKSSKSHASVLKRRSNTGRTHPRLITLGGDHSIALPVLQSLHEVYGPISVLHFDSHLDTWSPGAYPTQWTSTTTDFTHGTMFHLAAQSGYISNGTSVHAGLRTRLTGNGFDDYEHDEEVGFKIIEARDIDSFGVEGIIEMILDVLGHRAVYLSIDIDVLDPGIAPGTGTPESGGWTMRELLSILRGLKNLNIVGADVVEVSPAYDNAGETTSLAAADLVFEILGLMVASPGMEVDGYIPPKTFTSSKMTSKSGSVTEDGASVGCARCGGSVCQCKSNGKECCMQDGKDEL